MTTLRNALALLRDLFLLWTSAEPRLRAVERLSRLTDAELAQRGTTRAAELNRILGPQAAY